MAPNPLTVIEVLSPNDSNNEDFWKNAESPPESPETTPPPNRFNLLASSRLSYEWRKLKLYCFGGRKLDSVSRLNISTGEWSLCRVMPNGALKFAGAKAGDKIYICGGYYQKYLNTLSVYDCTTERWSQLREMPKARLGCAAAALNGYIYVTGGCDGNERHDASAFRYDIRNDHWEKLASMQMNRRGHQLVELTDKLYAICGWPATTVERFDPGTGSWTFVAQANYPHRWAGATTHQGRIYVCSEYGFEAYTPETDTWEVLPSLDEDSGRTLVSVGDKIWALGGGQFKRAESSMFEYDLTNRKWSPLPDMDIPRIFHCSFVLTE